VHAGNAGLLSAGLCGRVDDSTQPATPVRTFRSALSIQPSPNLSSTLGLRYHCSGIEFVGRLCVFVMRFMDAGLQRGAETNRSSRGSWIMRSGSNIVVPGLICVYWVASAANAKRNADVVHESMARNFQLHCRERMPSTNARSAARSSSPAEGAPLTPSLAARGSRGQPRSYRGRPAARLAPRRRNFVAHTPCSASTCDREL
jgi:hypothetical protein